MQVRYIEVAIQNGYLIQGRNNIEQSIPKLGIRAYGWGW